MRNHLAMHGPTFKPVLGAKLLGNGGSYNGK